jgi:hypothetical protein
MALARLDAYMQVCYPPPRSHLTDSRDRQTQPTDSTDRLNLKHGRQCAQSSRNEPQNVTPQVLRYPLPDLLTERSLYDSGKYTDLLITCGSDTYKVHKSVVCNRSGFFERAERFPVSAEKVR